MIEIDETTAFGAKVARRLKEEEVLWLDTVAPDLTPQPTPVWFYWTGKDFLIFSQPIGKKLRNIRQHPRVAVHFNSDEYGGDILVFTGEAQILSEKPPEPEIQAYLKKYERGMKDLEMEVDDFMGSYSVAIRVYPHRIRGD
jgi:PPOX class probable F420-dependent enzyme